MSKQTDYSNTEAGTDLWRRIEAALRRIDDYPDPAVWIHRLAREQIKRQVEEVTRRRSAGASLPLYGLTFGVKDTIDIAGLPTTAACPDFAYTAKRTSPSVELLLEAGAILIGKTNLDQFATGLVGVRSPYGACRNVFDPKYISGGSSSGSAVAVAAGLVDFSLGTDTAGSGRVPAAFNNIVGLKPTRGLISTTGLVPACKTLDCISVFAKTSAEAQKVFAVVQSFDSTNPYSRDARFLRKAPKERFRFGVPAAKELEFFGDKESESRFTHGVRRATAAGGIPVEIDYAPFREAAKLLYDGPWVAERLHAIREFYAKSPQSLLPVICTIIGGAEKLSAVDAFDGMYRLAEFRRRADVEWQKMDVMLLPTAGTIYTSAQIEADPIQLNKNLGYYTNFVNLLDLCAIALPNGFLPSGLPTGISFVAPAGCDDWLLELGERFERSEG